MIIVFISLFLFAAYGSLIIFYWLSWRSIPFFKTSPVALSTKISVIIPARNEEKNIASCIRSVCDQEFPRGYLQVIVVDDGSSDNTWARIEECRGENDIITALRLEDPADPDFSAHKKRAIERGIEIATGRLIVTTDADCTHDRLWLDTIARRYQETGAALIVAPVVFLHNNSVLEIFQALDFLVLQGITGAAVHQKIHSMCNGANLAYERDAFKKVNGFEGVDTIASGDDMLLMHKIWRLDPSKIFYLKSEKAIVTTEPMTTWKEFFNQRKRWASKARFYDDKRISLVLLLVYLFNLSFPVLLVAGIWQPVLWLWLAAFWIAKTLLEFPFIYSVASFFGKRSLLKYFFIFQPLHIAYTVLAGLLGQSGKYEWKGRKVR